MPRKSIKINWLGMETEIRMILEDQDFDPSDALRCIDETVARYTGRGNSINPPLSLDDPERKRLENQYPAFFDWSNFM